MTSETNVWELYSSKPGWQDVTQRLEIATVKALTLMDFEISHGVQTASYAASKAFRSVQMVMDDPVNAGFGAGDTEPRQYLADRINRHLSEKHNLPHVSVSRWG